MDRERLKRIRNFQSKNWYPAVVIRPLCILVMMAIADVRFLTPNLMTHLGNLAKLAAALFIFLDQPGTWIAAAILLQVGLLFDHLDGTLARYRRAWSSFGSYYDKVSDALTWFLIVMAMGWVGYRHSGDVTMLILAAESTYALLAIGYMKWVAHAEEQRLEWHRALDDPDTVIARRTRPPLLSEPPERGLRDWMIWLARSMAQIVRFDEPDLFFWGGLALIIDRLDLFLWLLAITQTLGVIIMFVKRGLDVYRVDVGMRPYRKRETGGA